MELEPDLQRRQSRQADQGGSATTTDPNDNTDEQKVVYLRDHLGAAYVFPLELCRSQEETESLWKEIYAKRDQSLLDRITKGEYVVQSRGATILPSVWSAIVRPNVTIQIIFPEEQFDFDFRRRPLPPSRSPSPSRHQRDEPAEAADDVRVVTFDVDSPRPPMPHRESDLSESADDSESATSTSDRSSSPKRTDLSEPPRDVVAPVDAEGNQLSFQVDTKHLQNLIDFGHESGDRSVDLEPHAARKDGGNFRIETFRITRAMIEEAQGRSQLQIHVLPGPENPHLQSAVASTWCHISASQLDFTHFRDVCLSMPHMSDRLRKLTSEMLAKVYAARVKPFDGGMFIEPGTVLRADESNQPDPQSVIFTCVPYLALQPQPRKSSRPDSNLFPQRTLMQNFYPYEPVRERDAEQSYRRFDDDRSDNIIYVPNLWMMIIGSSHIVTCGYELLSKEMTNSMSIVEEDIKQLSMKQVADNDLTSIRFTDWGGRSFIFPLSACRSYFQMEAKAREIGYMINNRTYNAKIRLQCRSQEGSFNITPKRWKDVVIRTDMISISVTSVSDDDAAKYDQFSAMEHNLDDHATSSPKTVPPFFHWPQQHASRIDNDHKSEALPDPSTIKQPSVCLEQVEKALTTEILEGSIINAVDETFTSTDHYQSQPKATYADARADFANLRHQCGEVKKAASGPTFHQITIDMQRVGILEKSIEFFDVTCMICDLFASDKDESEITGKIWGVMVKMYEYAVKLEGYRPSDQHPDGNTAPKQENIWHIRSTSKPCLLSLPDSSPELIKSIGRCRHCRQLHPFDSQEDALRHLQRHVNAPSESEKAAQADRSPKKGPSAQGVPLDSQAKAWVIASAEFWQEQTNAGVLEILTKACTLAKTILHQARELMQGVQNEDGQMSQLYTLPKELPGTFRAIVVFLMATERAVYEADMARGQYYRLSNSYETDPLPYSKRGLEVLEKFKGDAIRSLMVTRSQLCYMARSEPPLDVTKHLSRGPEYICGWLMRRLLLRPISKRATVGDLYREFISRLQFQVNHRPSKRLLRDLNLLQEELQILMSINTQQANLVKNYLCVLDDATYEKLMPSRQSMFPYERILLGGCLDNLNLVMEDNEELIRRCGPLASRTKQSLEINEEDHGKAIMVFTVVTVIFLPLSFATSYLGMNTADIRNMDQKQSLFWIVAIPLTVVTVGACLLIGYNGDEIRDMIIWLLHKAMGRQEKRTGGGGISVPRRKRPLNALGNSSSSTLESSVFPNESEVINPRPVVEYSHAAYPTVGWVDAEDAWYTPRYEPTIQRAPTYTTIPETRTQSRLDHGATTPATSYRVRYSSSRNPRQHASVRHDYDYVEDRPRRSGYHYYPEPPPYTGYHYNDRSGFRDEVQDVPPQRRTYALPRVLRPEVPIRQPSARAYELDHSDDGEAYGYTWEKKRTGRRHNHRTARSERFYERSDGEDYRER